MLDLKAIREDPEPVRKALARRGPDVAELLDRALALDDARRVLQTRVDEVRAEQNRLAKAVGAASPEERPALIERARGVPNQLKELEAELDAAGEALQDVAVRLPNLPEESVPDGAGEEDNVEVRVWPEGGPPSFDFEPRDHLELGAALGMIDVERAARTSGSRFAYLTGDAALVQFALVQLALETALRYGFVPVVPPVLVRREAMFGTGFLPTDEAQIYTTRDDDLYLVGTSEVPLAAMHATELLDPDRLPIRYVGYSTCFRREAGSHGKDTRGIFRVHQFDKVEMFAFVFPEDSADEHERLLSIEEEFVRSLEIPYRVVNVCTGDLGASAAKKYDIEAWMPGQQRYREITSTSNTTDFQARRLETRVRLEEGNRPVHTLNGTLVAIGRTLIALLENGQREDGSVELPEILRRYLPSVE
jgi:seryl-tRNA synthetase